MKRGEPWFEDGNIILYASLRHGDKISSDDETTGFRVHRGFLARQSEVFKSMLEIPQPEHSTEMMVDVIGKGGIDEQWLRGCQFVQMHDDTVELGNLLKALYDGFSYQYNCIEDFFYLAGILHLSTRYFIASLRTNAIAALCQTWSHTLSSHDAMVERALQEDARADSEDISASSFRFPYVHPLHVLNLARTLDVRILVPPTLYFLSMYPLADILRADHPKLMHGAKVMGQAFSSTLSREDLENVALMHEHRINVMLDFCRTFLASKKPSKQCANSSEPKSAGSPPRPTTGPNSCARGFASLASKASRSWYPRTGPLRWMQQIVRMAERDDVLCGVCRRVLHVDVEEYRNKIWRDLPGVVRMQNWEELAKDDLG